MHRENRRAAQWNCDEFPRNPQDIPGKWQSPETESSHSVMIAPHRPAHWIPEHTSRGRPSRRARTCHARHHAGSPGARCDPEGADGACRGICGARSSSPPVRVRVAYAPNVDSSSSRGPPQSANVPDRSVAGSPVWYFGRATVPFPAYEQTRNQRGTAMGWTPPSKCRGSHAFFWWHRRIRCRVLGGRCSLGFAQ
jgi:hypothetical protein